MANSKNAKTQDKAKSENITIDIKEDLKNKENTADSNVAAKVDEKTPSVQKDLEQEVKSLEQAAEQAVKQEAELRATIQDSANNTQKDDTDTVKEPEKITQSADAEPQAQPAVVQSVPAAAQYEVRTVVKEKSYTGVIFGSLMLITAAFGYLSYDFFNKINSINMQLTATDNLRSSLDEAKVTLVNNMKQIDDLKTQNLNLSALNANLSAQNKELGSRVEALTLTQQQSLEASKQIIARLDKYEDRDPYAWRIAEAYFMSKQAFSKAMISSDVKSALWFLREADSLLANIQDKDIIKLRKEMSKDIIALSNIKEVDRAGMSFTLNALFNNVNNLVIKGFMSTKGDDKAQEVAKSGDVADWKTNLLSSAKEFSSKFIEVRRRSGEELTEFLSPQQDQFLRENIKTRITLALSNLSNLEDQSFRENLNTARNLVNTYFEAESQVTVSMLAELDKLIAISIKPDLPETLQSYILFDKIYNKRQANRG